MGTQSVLAVCAANICRSPAISLLVTQELARRGIIVDSASAGASAREGATMCEAMAAQLEVDALARDIFAEHRSRALAVEQITDAQLILTASLEERAAVARLVPQARTRTFTMREAAFLAEGAVQAQLRIADGALPTLADILNGQRGRLRMPTSAPARWWRPSTGHPFDVPDAHTSRVRHERVLGEINDGVQRFGSAVAGLLVASP